MAYKQMMTDDNTPLNIETDGKTWFMEALRNPEETVTIKFNKKDGSSRTMTCTLAESLIPADKAPKSAAKTAEGDEQPTAQAVFDTEIGEWRSFRWDSLTAIEVK